jgi:ribosomal protein L12E/L44/L45/RPP1/RPP2
MPRPPRFRGRDLGPLLATAEPAADDGLAWAETEDRTLVAKGPYRLVCARRERACALYDHRDDPGELRDRGDAEPAVKAELRALARQIEGEHGRFEAGAAQRWPEPLRRLAQGDRDALDEALPLLDDVKPELRSALADACLRMRDARCADPLARALEKESEPETKALMALALAELGSGDAKRLEAALAGTRLLASGKADPALAALGNTEAGVRLVARARAFADGTAQAEESERRRVLEAVAASKAEGWVDALLANLDDVRLRDALVPALAKSARWDVGKRIAALLEEEREPALRMVEIAALEALRAQKDFEAGLRFVAGLPEPPGEALERALATGLVREGAMGCALTFEKKGRVVARAIGTMKRGPWRILVKGTVDEGAVPTFELDGEQRMPMTPTTDRADVFHATPPVIGQAQLTLKPGPGFHVDALWLVPATQDPALAKRAKRPGDAADERRTESCTEGATCAKAEPGASEARREGRTPHTNRVDPVRARGAAGAANAAKAKRATEAGATEAKASSKAKTPKTKRPGAPTTNETTP